jgi:molecular chaperone DnaJ
MVVQVRDTLLGRMQTSSPCPQCRGTGYTIPNPCKHCRGSGFEARSVKHGVTVPAGIESGMTVRVAGQGHHGRGGAPAGDLLLTVTIEPHELFEREGPHLYLTLPVGYADLALGATVEVPTMGEPEKLRIPAGTPSHHTFTLRGRGLPRLQRSGHGDLTVQAELDVPRKVSKRQRELLEELRELESEAQERRGGFLKGIFGRDK